MDRIFDLLQDAPDIPVLIRMNVFHHSLLFHLEFEYLHSIDLLHTFLGCINHGNQCTNDSFNVQFRSEKFLDQYRRTRISENERTSIPNQ